MYYIQPKPNTSGAFPAPQSKYAKSLIPLTDEQTKLVIDYNGFVNITSNNGKIEVTPNTEKWEEWKAQQEQQEQSEPLDEITKLKLAIAELAAIVESNEVNTNG